MKKAFTLSEVLITLGIIGIVAALTVPGVMKNYKNRLYVAQLRKVYAQTAEAAQAIMADEHCADFYETKAAAPNSCSNADKGECEAGAGYFLNKYYKVLNRNCDQKKNSNCLPVDKNDNPINYTSIDGRSIGRLTPGKHDYYCIQTTNRATLCAQYSVLKDVKYFIVNVDVNGSSSPNMAGRDYFAMGILPNGLIVDVDNTLGHQEFRPSPDRCSNPNSAGCLQKIIDAGWKMEY